MPSSRLSGFYQQPVTERAAIVARWADLSAEELAMLSGEVGLSAAVADKLVENVVGIFGMPLGIAPNFIVNGRDLLVPMVVEEPSVIAAASNMARLAREGGGFSASSSEPLMIGQLQVLDLADLNDAAQRLLDAKEELLAIAAEAVPRMIRRGGGPRDIEVRLFPETPVGSMLVLHLILDVRNAMGANLINTACEALSQPVSRITGGRVALRILSNLADRRITRAECRIPASALAMEGYTGEEVIQGIIEAWAFAHVDPYRATTHNKGIMNGIDPLVIATGNDWRAVEAAAHAYAARDGQYRSLSVWGRDEAGNLVGELELPLALGIVGGTTRAHPITAVALKILGVSSAGELAEIAASVGLAQNLGALRALATEGIQKGHMALHARQIAIAAGARAAEIDRIAGEMVRRGQINLATAESLLNPDQG